MSEKQEEFDYGECFKGGDGAPDRLVLKKGRTECTFEFHEGGHVRRGERFCDASKGESPEDQVPKLFFRFYPCDPKITSRIPDDKLCEIGFMLTPSFGKKARLPKFLQSLSKDGLVPDFKGSGDALKKWLNSHLGHRYMVDHEPSGDNTRNYGVALAYKGPPLKAREPEKQDDELGELFVSDSSVIAETKIDDDDIPF